jgi:hypothetical protein|tara:strand:+ start:199 stop:396 length:198 start_codon:yes stop_codon:yes gene_type:complete
MAILNKVQLEMRLKEMEMKKFILAKKLGITTVTLHNKFKNPNSFTVSELEKLTTIGFFKSLIIEL